jgi:hypothetical protein
MVTFPVPGPTSRTVSVDLRPAFSTMDLTTKGFLRICWPRLLLNNGLVAEVELEEETLVRSFGIFYRTTLCNGLFSRDFNLEQGNFGS